MPAVRGRTLSTWGTLFQTMGLSGSKPFTGKVIVVTGSDDTIIAVTGSDDTIINVTGSL